MKTGVLLLNLGTPKSPATGDVRRYLREFLSDPRVLDINPLGRWALLNLVILPFRPAKSGAAYRQIWTERGSPLLANSQDLSAAVAAALGPDVPVVLAMRYGQPSIAAGLDALAAARVERIVAAPLYPQYAASSTGSSIERLYQLAGARWNVTPIDVVPPFYHQPAFLDAFAAIGRARHQAFRPDHVLFSFHGLPERHIRKSDESGAHCLASAGCCDAIGPVNRNCYRAQSFYTARQLAERLGLAAADYTVCFQSRLGRTPWISPYTDLVIPELARAGKRRLLVFSPAFVADCLETLEELAIRARDQWLGVGGEALELVPSLNATPAWVSGLTDLIKEHL